MAAEKKYLRKTAAWTVFLLVGALTMPLHAYTVIPLRHRMDLSRGFSEPSDVAVGRDDFIYVLDGVNSAVKVFDGQGAFRLAFGSRGGGPGQFESPLGIATDTRGNVYVADTGNHRVQIFGPEGAFQRQIEVKAGGNLRPSDPVDVAVDQPLERLYAVDNDNHRVLAYSLESGELISAWGSEGGRADQFRYPFFIAAGPGTSMLVVDVLNTRVQSWDRDRPATTIGGWGVDPGQFYRPKGVCTDAAGRVFVSDSSLGVIQVFDRRGNFSAVLGTQDGEVLKWKTPVGISVDGRRRLYVVEMLPNRVRVYDILDDQKLEEK